MNRRSLLQTLPAFALPPTARAGEARVFRAGAATSVITPPLGVKIVGNFAEPLAAHIHDELHARCLVLDDGMTRLAFAICDNLGLAREVCDEAKRLIHHETGLALTNILISATHTHSGPSARYGAATAAAGPLDEYQLFLARRIADGVRRAINNLTPARIGWGVAREPNQVFNRRWHMKPGAPMGNPFGGTDLVRMNPGVGNPDLLEPAGPTDPEVAFLSVQTAEGKPLALFANYGLHYVGGVPSGHISADYFALFADRVQQRLSADRLNPPFVGLMTNGTSGDVNNINFRTPRPGVPPYQKMTEVADAVAEVVVKAQAAVKHHAWVPLAAAQEELALVYRKPTPEQIARAKGILARPANAKPDHPLELPYARRTLDMAELPSHMRIVLQAFRLGDLGLAAIPFEVFAEIGLELKAKSPFQPSFTISLANGSGGYLPTPPQHRLGGYETWLGTSRVEFEASTKIVATLLRLMEQLKR